MKKIIFLCAFVAVLFLQTAIGAQLAAPVNAEPVRSVVKAQDPLKYKVALQNREKHRANCIMQCRQDPDRYGAIFAAHCDQSCKNSR